MPQSFQTYKQQSLELNLAKLGDGLDKSPTVMVGDRKNNSEKVGA